MSQREGAVHRGIRELGGGTDGPGGNLVAAGYLQHGKDVRQDDSPLGEGEGVHHKWVHVKSECPITCAPPRGPGFTNTRNFPLKISRPHLT